MDGKDWFEKSGYLHKLDMHDEGGFLGIDEDKVGEMLEEYHKYKLSLPSLDNKFCEDCKHTMNLKLKRNPGDCLGCGCNIK